MVAVDAMKSRGRLICEAVKEDAGDAVMMVEDADNAMQRLEPDDAEIKAHLICRCYGHKVGGAALK